jgi:hypothetical protein
MLLCPIKLEIIVTMSLSKSVSHLIDIARGWVNNGQYITCDGLNPFIDNYPGPYVVSDFMILHQDYHIPVEYSFVKNLSQLAYKNKQMRMNCWQFILLCMKEAGLITKDDIQNLYHVNEHCSDERIPNFFIDQNKTVIKNAPLTGDIVFFRNSSNTI